MAQKSFFKAKKQKTKQNNHKTYNDYFCSLKDSLGNQKNGYSIAITTKTSFWELYFKECNRDVVIVFLVINLGSQIKNYQKQVS